MIEAQTVRAQGAEQAANHAKSSVMFSMISRSPMYS